jgi:hypothetical protein
MNKLPLIIISLLFLLFCSISLYANDMTTGNTITLKLPPKTLAQWYKPENKRQVWLHTMFRLRREILAMQDYSSQQQDKDLQKWSQKFIKDYQSIADMVPQWQDYLKLEYLSDLESAVKNKKYSSIAPILKKLGKSCMNCHDDYKTIATLLYRTPDFSQEKIESHDYDDAMEQLSNSLNRINIAIKDEYFSKAQQLIQPLENQITHLAANCSQCHKKDDIPVERIIGASKQLLPELSEKLELKDKKQSGRKLGEFAVKVCARCHAVHRLTSDLKQQF